MDKKNWFNIFKTLLQLIVYLVLFILIFPVLIIISIVLIVVDGAPIFYKQERIGQHDKKFTLYKFRTMNKNNTATNEDLIEHNEACFPFFKIEKDPRVTKIGLFLRKTSLDELPQIINVLKGDMNLVGVRPVLENEAAYMSDSYCKYKPGLTGPTQIYRNKKINLEEYNKLNDSFVENYSLWLKIKIIFQTFKVVNKGV